VSPDITTCLLMTENQQNCWQSLFREFSARLNSAETKLQESQAECRHLEAQRQQLQDELTEAQTQQQALIEAATAQAQQFSQTLKQLRENQSQIIQAEKMSSLGQLVAGVAHEINNPVNFISGNLTHAAGYLRDLASILALYQTHYPDPVPEIQAAADAVDLDFLLEDSPQLLASMQLGTERIQTIVKSLRNFSRMDEAEVKAVNLHNGIDSTLMILQHRLKAHANSPGITVVKNYGELPEVECFAGQMNQVFMNLLANAIDALENNKALPQAEPATITISTQALSGDWVEIRVTDNGPGIPAKIQEKLFDPFFTMKPVGKGTGLGLSISYQVLTERHGGCLTCQSNPGQGTTFVIEIPVRSHGLISSQISSQSSGN
jgi:signal transduction histidine kinase